MKTADKFVRFGNHFIDNIAVMAIVIFNAILLDEVLYIVPEGGSHWLAFYFFVIYFGYHFICEYFFGKTVEN